MCSRRGTKRKDYEEIALLPEGSAVAEVLSDYSVMRELTRGCDGSKEWR